MTLVVRRCVLFVVACCSLLDLVVYGWCIGFFVGARCCCSLFVVCCLFVFGLACSFLVVGRCSLFVVRVSFFYVRCSLLSFGVVRFVGCVLVLVVVCCVLCCLVLVFVVVVVCWVFGVCC